MTTYTEQEVEMIVKDARREIFRKLAEKKTFIFESSKTRYITFADDDNNVVYMKHILALAKELGLSEPDITNKGEEK